MVLELRFIELGIVEGRKTEGGALKRTDQLQLSGVDIDDQTEARLARKIETLFRLALCFTQHLPAGQQVCHQVVTAIHCKGQVAVCVRGFESAPHPRKAGMERPRPRIDDIAEMHIHAGLEAVQSALVHQIQSELAETESGLVIAEARPKEHAQPSITQA